MVDFIQIEIFAGLKAVGIDVNYFNADIAYGCSMPVKTEC